MSQQEQQDLCRKYGTKFVESPKHLKVGIARNVKEGALPINGLRHPPQGDTTGWYIWGGDELNNDSNAFEPLHVAHIADWCPAVLKYLGLPPGWRFLVTEDYEDVWEDESLLNV